MMIIVYPDLALPISHTPPEYKDTWPPLPWILRKILIPYVLARKYSGYVSGCLSFPRSPLILIDYQVLEIFPVLPFLTDWKASDFFDGGPLGCECRYPTRTNMALHL